MCNILINCSSKKYLNLLSLNDTRVYVIYINFELNENKTIF